MSRTTLAVAALAVAAGIVITGCQITPAPVPDYEVRPGTPEPVKVGEVYFFGVAFCLWDIDGDGVPDQILDPGTGQLFRVRAPAGAVPGDGADEVKIWLPGPLQPTVPGVLDDDQFAWVASHVEWDAGWDPPRPFDFGEMTAEAWIESVGLDLEPGTVADTSALALEEFDPRSWQADAWIFWSSAFRFPQLGDYDLQFETWALASEVENGPKFLALHVAGDAQEIIKLAASMGGRRYSFESGGSAWTVHVIDGGASVSLHQDGVWRLTVPLD